jgi:hypothetical protein
MRSLLKGTQTYVQFYGSFYDLILTIYSAMETLFNAYELNLN